MSTSTSKKARLVHFQCIPDERGNLAVAQGDTAAVPFAIRRAFWIFHVPEGAERGGHAHYQEQQLLVAVTGHFEVVVDDGNQRQTFRLDDPIVGLYVPAMLWRELQGFSEGAVCLTLSSTDYEEADYIRDYDDYRRVLAET